MIARYTILVTVSAAALYGAVKMSTTTNQMMLVDAGGGAGMSTNLTIWVLGGIAGLSTLSLCRFVVFGLPAIVGGWYASNKSRLATLILGGLASGVYYLM